jgi:NDP-sugar pyrophosphorylase family protein
MKRERLTITLRDDVLKLVDAAIDGETIRNRSHAIEVLLSQCLVPQKAKVLILAGGKPVYFDSEKRALPKAMVKIAGKPLLEQTLLRLKAAKFTDVIISIGKDGKIISDYFKDGAKWGMNISFLQQDENCMGTAQALLQAKAVLKDEEFLLLYGDVLCNIDYNNFLDFHRQQKSSFCTMALTSSGAVNLWGLAKLNGNKIISFEEKPKNPKTFSRLINAGAYCMNREIFTFLESSQHKLERDVFPRLAEEGKLFGYPYEGLWLDISNSAAYRQAVKEFKG